MTNADELSAPGFRRWMVLVLGALTLLVFGVGGALLITLAQGRPLGVVVFGEQPLPVQLAVGLGAGLFIGLGALVLIRRPEMRELDERFARRIGERVQRWQDRLFLSACAGVGEELFFRGALQHWLGIVPTALVFVAIHGYLDPRDRRMLVYGLYLTAAMCGVGLLARAMGLLAPMVAHSVIDVVLFGQLVRTYRSLPRHEPTDRMR
jgi:membrane protease YdiL (CAAX protease family)